MATRIAIELTPEEEARLRAVAEAAGLDLAECARRLVTEQLPPLSAGDATRQLLRAWREADATDDPEAIRVAEDELAAFQRALNEERATAGARPLYS